MSGFTSSFFILLVFPSHLSYLLLSFVFLSSFISSVLFPPLSSLRFSLYHLSPSLHHSSPHLFLSSFTPFSQPSFTPSSLLLHSIFSSPPSPYLLLSSFTLSSLLLHPIFSPSSFLSSVPFSSLKTI